MSVDAAGTEGKAAGAVWIFLLGLYLLILSSITIYLAVKMWPGCPPQDACLEVTLGPSGWGISPTISPDQRLFWLSVIFGAIGSYVHVAASFADYVGNRRLVASWIWWFILRTPIGVALAVIFYVVIRAGFMTTSGSNGDASDVNPYGIAAVSAMAGMFSKQATDKLNEVFSTLFKTGGDDQRGDKLIPGPKIDSIDPKQLRAADPQQALKIKGSGFSPQAKVKANDAEFTPSAVSATEITVTLTGLSIKAGDKIKIVVKNPTDAGGDSPAVVMDVI